MLRNSQLSLNKLLWVLTAFLQWHRMLLLNSLRWLNNNHLALTAHHRQLTRHRLVAQLKFLPGCKSKSCWETTIFFFYFIFKYFPLHV